ncbi:hypothetical protein [Rosistilla oblonga]|uniref:hypothetical protein n=1 Tax=Rosistilla oblonga TaxID=2527990 RepID=UPI003A97D923
MSAKVNIRQAAACLLLLAAIGCGETAPPVAEVTQSVYVDTDTMQAIVADTATQTPAVHPVTGKRTLQPALYCPKCERWHAIPSVEQINRKPGATRCPKTGAEMTADGPWPE